MTDTKTVDTAAAEALRDELENQLGSILEDVGEACETAGKLKALFDGNADFKDEYNEAAGWQNKLLFMPVADVLAQVAGEAQDDKDDDSPTQIILERKQVDWLNRLVKFAATIESAEFQQDACFEVQTTLEHVLS